VESHEHDLREEIGDEEIGTKDSGGLQPRRPRSKNRALLDFAGKLTLFPGEMMKADIDRLRENGFDDRDILDAAQLIGYFNYSNRVMDSLGIDPDPNTRFKKG
jgi:uncharacterized peroxidase-related enzyme